jgi:hypothetical protein
MSFGINQGKDPLDFEDASQGKRFIAISIDWAIAWSTATLLTPNIIPENAFSTLLVLHSGLTSDLLSAKFDGAVFSRG